MIRYFSQKKHPIHDSVLGGAAPSGTFVKDGTNPNFTGGVIGGAAWKAAGAPDDGWQTAHQLIPGMLLAHAISKSGF